MRRSEDFDSIDSDFDAGRMPSNVCHACVAASLYDDNGSALPAVLVIITVVTTLVGAVLAVRLVQFRFIQRDVQDVQAYYAAEAGLHYTIAQLRHDLNWAPQGHFPCTPTAQCLVQLQPYGGYLLVRVAASVRDETRHVRALIGQEHMPAFQNAIALGDADGDLTLAGGAGVYGDVMLLDGDVTQGALPNVPRGGEHKGQAIDDVAARAAGLEFPCYSNRVPHATMQHIEHMLTNGDDFTAWGDTSGWTKRGALSNVNGGLQQLYAREDVVLTPRDSEYFQSSTALYVAGNLTVKGELVMPPGSQLVARDTLRIEGPVRSAESVLFGGRQVWIEGWVRGSAQVLSKREIIVGSGAHLTYPSVLYVEGWEESHQEGSSPRRRGQIALNDGARVDGTLLYPATTDTGCLESPHPGRMRDIGTVSVDRGAVLRGALFSAARARIEGVVHGSVLTRHFHFYRSPTRYVNWIVGGAINVQQRPAGYVTPLGFGGDDGRGPASGRWPLTAIRLQEEDAETAGQGLVQP